MASLRCLVALCVLFCTVSCAEETQTRAIQSLGSVVSISLYDTPQSSYFEEAFAIVDQLHALMSLYRPQSDLSRLRSAAGSSFVELHPYTADLVNRSLEIARESDYAFTPFIEPLVRLWNIGSGLEEVPAPEAIQALLPLVEEGRLIFNSETGEAMLPVAGMGVDLGGIGKGYAADLVKEQLQKRGVRRAILDFGGNIVVIGRKDNESLWTIGIQDPLSERGDFIASLSAENVSLVSSGIYERYFISNGKRYHHLLNPKTGYPEDNDLLAVTVVSESSTRADAYATALYLLGLDAAYALAQTLPDIEALFITRERTIYLTPRLAPAFTLLSSDYEVFQR